MTFLISTNPVVTVSGIDPISSTTGPTPVVSIQDSTINQKGAVQLEDSVTSTSITKAATPKSVKDGYEYTTSVSGSLQDDLNNKSDIDHLHTESDITDLDKYTQAEVDTLITTISGKLDDHNELNNLDYASAGHTGFQPAGDYLTDSEFSTYSGTLQSQIDDKSGLGHDHDDLYYTESEVDTISGSLQTYIDNKATTLIDLTDTPSSYDDDKYLKSTAVGAEWATVSQGVNGTIFIYNLTPDAGNISITTGESGHKVVSATASVDVTQITCAVFAYSGHTNIRPGVEVNNQSVNWSTSITKDPVAYLGTVIVPVSGTLIATHEDGATHTVVVTTDAKPAISSVNFVNGYPGIQTELKSGDTFDINVIADINFVNIQVGSQQAFTSIQTKAVTAGTNRTSTFTIGDRGTVVHTYPARVRVQKSTGTWSDWVWTNGTGIIDSGADGSEVVSLNNLYPSVETMSQSSVTYPASQEAIKNTESVIVHSTCSNFDTITYSSPTGELTIPNTSIYQEDKASVIRNSGGYNVTSINYRIVGVRTANNATVTKNLIVYIAHDACTIIMTEPYTYLRSGGNDGTSVQNYIITLTSNQNLISTPTISALSANAGVWVGLFVGGPKTWTRTLQVHDTDIKATYNYGTLSATNLANTETTTYTGDSSYTLRGFISRAIELAAFANEVNMNVEAVTYVNVSMTWSAKSLPNKRAVGTTATPDSGSWCLHSLNTNPTIIRILDTAATDSQSQASTITIQEVI